MEAIKLFGGREKVMSKIDSGVRRKLEEIGGKDKLSLLEEIHFIKKGTFLDLLENGGKVNVELFEKICTTLGISLFDVFGKPDKKKLKSYLDEKHREELLCSHMPVGMYVTFEAARELRSEINA